MNDADYEERLEGALGSYPVCDVVETWCRCALPVGHMGPHACKCGGEWMYERGEFCATRWPGTPRGGRTVIAPNLTIAQLARLLDYKGSGLSDEAVASAMRGHGVVMDAGHVRRALDLLGELLERKL